MKYNLILIGTGTFGFALNELIVHTYSERLFINGEYPETTLFTIAFQTVGFVVALAMANLFYNLGHFVEVKSRSLNKEKLRSKLYAAGVLFSITLIALLPISTLVRVIFFPSYYDPSAIPI